MIKSETALFWMLLGCVVPIELFCAVLAYETIGEIFSTLLIFVIIVLNIAFTAIAIRRSTVLAGLAVVLLALAIVPRQLGLGLRLWGIQNEASQIVGYVYEKKIDTGEFPADLSDYTFANPDVKDLIQSYERLNDGADFMLLYYVGTETTSHWYSSETGWGYYPD